MKAPPGRQVVELRVGGQTYRVTTEGSPDEVRQLASMIEARLAVVAPRGKAITHERALFLAALSLAHDLTRLRGDSEAFTARVRDAFGRVLAQADAALDAGLDAAVEPDAGAGFDVGASAEAGARPEAASVAPRSAASSPASADGSLASALVDIARLGLPPARSTERGAAAETDDT